MSKVPLGRLSFTLLLLACAPSNVDRMAPPNNCARGNGTANKAQPVVCVSDTGAGLAVDPESIELWDVTPADKTKPVMIHWVTRSGKGDLQIRMKEEGCVEKIQCNKNGHCHAKAIDVTGSKRCTYGITLDGKELDPDVIVTDCC